MGPLADRMRPATLQEVVGQERWLAQGAPLQRAAAEGTFRAMVLWGPPGCGKTTLARLLAAATEHRFIQLSAVLSGVKDLRAAIERAKTSRRVENKGTVLFVDEIHRWNKAQQDALLPHVEAGTLVLIGATTENPSFELNAALRSRLQLIRLEPLSAAHIQIVLRRALNDPRGYHGEAQVEPAALEAIALGAAGDARRALTDLERALDALPTGALLTAARLPELLQRSDLRHDRSGEDHFDVLSALIKSLRGSDPQAALYWLARMLAAGEPPELLARRLIVFASEDVGNADPRGLQVAVAAAQAVQLVGLPEARINLAQAVTWLATCPKSNAAYLGIDEALAEVKRTGALPVPMHLRRAATAHLRSEGYGAGYLYPHDHPFGIAQQQHLPDALQGARYYRPKPYGAEKIIADRMDFWRRKLKERG